MQTDFTDPLRYLHVYMHLRVLYKENFNFKQLTSAIQHCSTFLEKIFQYSIKNTYRVYKITTLYVLSEIQDLL